MTWVFTKERNFKYWTARKFGEGEGSIHAFHDRGKILVASPPFQISEMLKEPLFNSWTHTNLAWESKSRRTSAVFYDKGFFGEYHRSWVDGFGFAFGLKVVKAPASLSANLHFHMIGTRPCQPHYLPFAQWFFHISDVALAKPSLKASNKFLLFSKLLNIPIW